jgi:predicted RNA-binding Zn ribbon-like protein
VVRYAYEVEGLTLPVRLGGHPALDFCNTAAGWGEDERKEYLVSYEHLRVWAREAGLVEAVRRSQAGGEVLARALSVRDALYPVLLGTDDDAHWSVVAAEAERAAAAARFSPPGRWTLPESPDGPILAVAAAAAELLTAADRPRVRACPGHGCGWLFLDPRGRRRWCDMAVCGNRAKARRHGARSRPPR